MPNQLHVQDALLTLRHGKTPNTGLIVIAVGPITGGTAPYNVDFTHAMPLIRVARHKHKFTENDAVPELSHFAGSVLVGGTAYATLPFHVEHNDDALDTFASVYIPPDAFVSVVDSKGHRVDVRLSKAPSSGRYSTADANVLKEIAYGH
jgi:hypothetical protein